MKFPKLGRLVALAFVLCWVSALPAQDFRFGVQTHFAQGWNLAWVPPVGQAGITSVRDELYWNNIEASPGVYAFPASFDAYMAALGNAGISPLIELDFANPNYDAGATPYDAAGIAGFCNYATQVLLHYGSQISAVEVWNEYDGNFCTGPAAVNRPVSYQALLQSTYATIKAMRPDVTVVAGATSGTDLTFFQGVFAAGGLASLDVLSLHPYRYTSPPEGIENNIASLQTLTRLYNNGATKPIWVSEIGWYTHTSTGPGDVTITNAIQAEYVVRCYALLLSAGVERVYWYLLYDNPSQDDGVNLGLLPSSLSIPPKPAYVAMTTLTTQLQGAQFVRREGTPNSTYSLLFQRSDGTQVRILWALNPMTVFVTGATGAVDMLGNTLPLSGSFALTPSPIFVSGALAGLPNQNGTVLADTLRDFSSTQGYNGWTLGYTIAGANFTAAPTFQLRNTSAPQWTAPFFYFSITQSDQLPSSTEGAQVAAVRRWTSNTSGRVEITANFATKQQGGNGVGASILINGKLLVRKLLGGGRTTSDAFDLIATISPGTTIDFAVDTGTGTGNSYDATAVDATITSRP